jgi:phosphoserine/homoserine phosphotransferase
MAAHPEGPLAGASRVQIVCLDLEGVLVPEIWIAFSERTGIPELRRTTRDEPDYDRLMRGRLDILRRHGLGLADIQRVIAGMRPEPGAKDFLDGLRQRYQVVILSDTFYEFAMPLMAQLGMPTLFCHRLEADPQGFVNAYHLRMPEQKRAGVEAFRALRFKVIAAGDSYNDTAMLRAAHAGILFRPPQNVVSEFPEFPAVYEYPSLRTAIDAAAVRIGG